MKEKTKYSISFILYILSFVPYLYIAYVSIFGIPFTFFFNTSMVYGYEAVLLVLLAYGVIIPIYPVILIFQIVYTAKKYKMFTRKCKTFIKSMIISLIVLITVAIIMPLLIETIEENKQYEKDKVVIENYLKNEL